MNYDKYQYLWPPRPENKVPRAMINFYEKQGWIAQVKKNGTCTVIFARGDEVIFKTRHDDDHRAWSPKPEHVKFFQGLGDKWNVFVGELLHSKTPHIKDHLFLFDQVVANGVHLVGMSFAKRHKLMTDRWQGQEDWDKTIITPQVSIAKNLTSDFTKVYDNLRPEDEGLVMKDPRAPLKACFKPNSNSGWQVKSRIPTKNYGF